MLVIALIRQQAIMKRT